MEIERKWVAEAVPAGVCERTGTRIEQAYLTSERDGPELRIRRRDGHCTLTVKSAGTLERTEVELAISGTDFDALRPLTDGRQLVKTRVEYPLSSDLVAEVDTFDDRALILAARSRTTMRAPHANSPTTERVLSRCPASARRGKVHGDEYAA